jgi:cell division protease FtsH
MNIFVLLPFLLVISNGFVIHPTRMGLNHLFAKKNNYHENKSYEKNRYPFSKKYYEKALKRLNSDNHTIQESMILGKDLKEDDDDLFIIDKTNKTKTVSKNILNGIQIIISGNDLSELGFPFDQEEEYEKDEDDIGFNEFEEEIREREKRKAYSRRNAHDTSMKTTSKDKKSENFEVMTNSGVCFADIGGYDSIKQELKQCIDILKNNTKYEKFNVRVPKGLIFEGPPGNGKTLIAKALATEAKTSFIPVSGAEFQEKYVGVGASRVRELFQLAKKNQPCIVFIDEIDALGRKRSGDGEQSSSERDSTLNELLVNLDGFKNTSGVFLVGATNRVDLLDSALMRPGRIDKKVYIGLPDSATREAILKIHIQGKPYDDSIIINDLIEQTNGFSGAQIENLLNEAMLLSLRENREVFTTHDFETVLNKMMVGWQPNDHEFSAELVRQIAVHEMGHVVAGMMSKHHANITKVLINLSSPNSPGYTVFETKNSNIYTREYLFEHLTILLAGRIAEELIYGESITTGAVNDFEEALKLAEKMVNYYGMGDKVIYPNKSDKQKEKIDDQVTHLIHKAYDEAELIVKKSKNFIIKGAEILQEKKIIRADELKLLLVLEKLWVK